MFPRPNLHKKKINWNNPQTLPYTPRTAPKLSIDLLTHVSSPFLGCLLSFLLSQGDNVLVNANELTRPRPIRSLDVRKLVLQMAVTPRDGMTQYCIACATVVGTSVGLAHFAVWVGPRFALDQAGVRHPVHGVLRQWRTIPLSMHHPEMPTSPEIVVLDELPRQGLFPILLTHRSALFGLLAPAVRKVRVRHTHGCRRQEEAMLPVTCFVHHLQAVGP